MTTDNDIDHAKCDPALHDFDAPDTADQARVGDQMTCNDDQQPLFYCETSGWYHHVGADAVPCFMVRDDGYDVQTPHAADAARATLLATWLASCRHPCITAGCASCNTLTAALKAAGMPLPVSPDTEPGQFTEAEAELFRDGYCSVCGDKSKRGADRGHCDWHDFKAWQARHGH